MQCLWALPGAEAVFLLKGWALQPCLLQSWEFTPSREQEQLQSHSASWDLVTLETANTIQYWEKSHKSVTSSRPPPKTGPWEALGSFANAPHQKFWLSLLLTHTEMLTGNTRSQEHCQLCTGKRPRQTPAVTFRYCLSLLNFLLSILDGHSAESRLPRCPARPASIPRTSQQEEPD